MRRIRENVAEVVAIFNDNIERLSTIIETPKPKQISPINKADLFERLRRSRKTNGAGAAAEALIPS